MKLILCRKLCGSEFTCLAYIQQSREIPKNMRVKKAMSFLRIFSFAIIEESF